MLLDSFSPRRESPPLPDGAARGRTPSRFGMASSLFARESVFRRKSCSRFAVVFFSFFGIVFFLTSCASTNIQPAVHSYVAAGRPDLAIDQFERHPKGYGKNSELLYLIDKGLVLHYAGRYRDSAEAFEQAKLKYDELFTRSVSKFGQSWLWNNSRLPYRGEDFERVLINVFQAVNYAAQGNFEEALVEARDVDSVLHVINSQYPPETERGYRDDAFARLLSGVLYEASRTTGDWGEALVAYRRAWEIYRRDYQKHYATPAPQTLKENLLTAVMRVRPSEAGQWRRELEIARAPSPEEKEKSGEIYVVQYQGLAPRKHEETFPLPLPDGYITRFSFPQYDDHHIHPAPSAVTARNEQGREWQAVTEAVEDVAKIAVKNLEWRRMAVMSKAVARPIAKYALSRAAESQIQDRYGSTAGSIFQIGSSIFSLLSEQSDLRSWQTLPAQIRIARLILPPGEYDLQLDGRQWPDVRVAAGEKKFLVAGPSDSVHHRAGRKRQGSE